MESITTKKIVLLGAGYMGNEFAKALSALNINDVTVISNNPEKAKTCAEKFGFKHFGKGLETLEKLDKQFDLMISAIKVHDVLKSATIAINKGIKNILLEKPSCLSSRVLDQWITESKLEKVNIRTAFNRMVYPNVKLLLDLCEKDGGIISCNYSFTEWTNDVESYHFDEKILSRWGIYNSLHIISLVHQIIGFPKDYRFYQNGLDIDWHKSGSIFNGSGITEKGIPFSYHSNWASAGRWYIDFMTRKNCYRLMPIEKLQVSSRYTVKWEFVEFENKFPEVKQGLAEEILFMLGIDNGGLKLPNIMETKNFISLAEVIFGYQQLD